MYILHRFTILKQWIPKQQNRYFDRLIRGRSPSGRLPRLPASCAVCILRQNPVGYDYNDQFGQLGSRALLCLSSVRQGKVQEERSKIVESHLRGGVENGQRILEFRARLRKCLVCKQKLRLLQLASQPEAATNVFAVLKNGLMLEGVST
jgi:hypothetical protein